ncbi:hypothetical protein KQ718_15680, partial [Listeria monocytogenes]|nr:hypothetical protein [Listeria monocytogenes]
TQPARTRVPEKAPAAQVDEQMSTSNIQALASTGHSSPKKRDSEPTMTAHQRQKHIWPAE